MGDAQGYPARGSGDDAHGLRSPVFGRRVCWGGRAVRGFFFGGGFGFEKIPQHLLKQSADAIGHHFFDKISAGFFIGAGDFEIDGTVARTVRRRKAAEETLDVLTFEKLLGKGEPCLKGKLFVKIKRAGSLKHQVVAAKNEGVEEDLPVCHGEFGASVANFQIGQLLNLEDLAHDLKEGEAFKKTIGDLNFPLASDFGGAKSRAFEPEGATGHAGHLGGGDLLTHLGKIHMVQACLGAERDAGSREFARKRSRKLAAAAFGG